MKKYAPWVAIVIALIAVLALLLAPKLSSQDDTSIPTPTPVVSADTTQAPVVGSDDVTADATSEPDAVPASDGDADASADGDVAVIVNGIAVTTEDVNVIVDNMLYAYSMYGYDTSDAELVSAINDYALQYAIQLELMEQEAVKRGFDQMTDEEKATAETEVTTEWEELIDTYIAYYVGLADDATDEDKAAARVTAIAGLEAMGYTQTALMDEYTEDLMFDKVYAEMVKDAEVTDEEITAAFNEQVETDRASYENNVATFEYMTQYYGQTSYYQPEGYRGITHILLEVDDELLTTYQDLAAELEEQQEAAEEATTTDLDEVDQVTQEDVDAAYAAIIASVQPTIDEINQKLAEGVSFDDLIAEYGKDPGMTSDPYKTEGYSVHMDSIIWDPAFVKAAFSVDNVGDIAEPVVGSYGVHIVKYHRDVPAGAVELTEDIMSSLRETLLADKENELYNTMMTEWMNSAVLEYPDATATATDAE